MPTPTDSLNATRKALMRTRSVLKQMAAGAKNGARRPVVLDLADVFNRASPLLARLAGDDTECDVVGPGQPLLVAADPAEVDQLLTAIVLSGRECLPAGGRLSLSGRVFPAEVSRDGQTVVQPSVALTLCASGYGAQPVVWQQASDLAAHLGGIRRGATRRSRMLLDDRGRSAECHPTGLPGLRPGGPDGWPDPARNRRDRSPAPDHHGGSRPVA